MIWFDTSFNYQQRLFSPTFLKEENLGRLSEHYKSFHRLLQHQRTPREALLARCQNKAARRLLGSSPEVETTAVASGGGAEPIWGWVKHSGIE